MVSILRNIPDFKEVLSFYCDGQVRLNSSASHYFFFLPTSRHLVIYTFGTILLCGSRRENGNYYFQYRTTEKVVQPPAGGLQLLKNPYRKDAGTGLISSTKWCLGKGTYLLCWSRPGNLSSGSATHWSNYALGRSSVEEWRPELHMRGNLWYMFIIWPNIRRVRINSSTTSDYTISH